MFNLQQVLDYYKYEGKPPTIAKLSRNASWCGRFNAITNLIEVNSLACTYFNALEFTVAHEVWHYIQSQEGRLGYELWEGQPTELGLVQWLGDYYSYVGIINSPKEYKLITYDEAGWEHEANVMALSYCEEYGYNIPEQIRKQINEEGAA